MARLNVSIEDRLRDEFFKLVPPRRRSQVINEALRTEDYRRRRIRHLEGVLKKKMSRTIPEPSRFKQRASMNTSR
jgi:hypothetical protein